MLRNSNTPIIEAINISLKTISNRSLRESLDFHLIKVNEGDSIASSLSRVKHVPPLVNQMVASGEAGGNLEKMLSKAAEYLDQEFQQTSKIFMGFLEPLVVLIMGGLVAAIVAAVLLPLIDMNSVSLLN
jgi:general secretion pathway protein F